MPERIPQSVTIRVPLQAFLASDHVSPATGIVPVITISKNGGAYGNPSAGATVATEIANGSYYVDLSTTDTGTVGPLFVRGAVATMDPITAIYNVVAFVEQTGDAFTRIGANGAGLTAVTGVTLAAAQKVDVDTIKTQAVTCAAAVTVLASVGTAATSTAQTGDAYARLGAPVGASTSADIAATKALLPTALVGGKMDSHVNDIAAGAITATSIAADAITDAKVASDVTIASVTGAVGSVTGAVGSVTGAVGSVTGNVGGNVGGSVGSVASYGTLVADVATAVWAAGTRSLTTFGTLVADAAAAVWSAISRTITGTVQLDANQPNYAPAVAGDAMTLTTGERTSTGTAVWASATRILTAGTNIVLAKGTGVTGFNDPTAAATASAVRTELATELDLVASNNAGIAAIYNIAADGGYGNAALKTLIDALPAATRDVDNSTPAAGSLGEAARGADAKAAVVLDTIGTPANVTVSGDLADILSAANAIGERTQNLPDAPASEGTLTAAAAAILAVLGTPAGASIATDIANKTGYRLSAAGVNDLLRTALTEGYAANGAAATLEQLMHMIWSYLANKSTSGTTLTTDELDGATPAMTFTLDKAKNPTSQVRAT